MEIKIEKNFGSDSVRLYVINRTTNGTDVITIGPNGKDLNINNQERGNKIEPFLEISAPFFEDFAKAILVYTEENNIKSERQTFLEGELIATKKHLADLQLYIKKLFSKK